MNRKSGFVFSSPKTCTKIVFYYLISNHILVIYIYFIMYLWYFMFIIFQFYGFGIGEVIMCGFINQQQAGYEWDDSFICRHWAWAISVSEAVSCPCPCWVSAATAAHFIITYPSFWLIYHLQWPGRESICCYWVENGFIINIDSIDLVHHAQLIHAARRVSFGLHNSS